MIERAVARHPGTCDLCPEPIHTGDEIAAGTEDDAYMHAACVDRQIELDRREDERQAEASLDATAYLNGGQLV